ncbi:MAG: hypothetical protein Q7R67_00775 [bacterium]|nr:hypothetical protein [bacterium]
MRRIHIHESQLTLPFLSAKAGGEGRAVALSLESRQRFFWLTVSISVFSLLAYIYGIYATAHHIAVRAHLEEQVANIESKLGALEFAYIGLKNNVSMDTAHQFGFKDVRTPLYVSRDAHTDSLTLNTIKR